MAKISMVKTFRVFLASSSELSKDRKDFERLISRLNHHYESRDIHYILDIWEYLDPTYMDRRKQDEYNEYVRKCDVFVVLFYHKAGDFTLEEFNVAEEQNKQRKLPLFIYFKENRDSANEKESVELTKFKNHISLQLEHFWGTYDTTPELHLDFVLWLDNYLFSGNTEVKAVDGTVTMGGVPVALMSQLPFAANNEEYQRLDNSLKLLDEDIEQIKQDIQDYPENAKFPERLSKKVMERDKVQEELTRQQDALLGAAKRIAEIEKENVSKKLQEAIEAFKAGQLERANTLLDQIAHDAESHVERLDQNREIVHKDIEALLLQTETIMAEAEKPIGERTTRVAEIYAKVDDWASRSAYNKEKYVQLLSDYGRFLFVHVYYNEAEKTYQRLIKLSEELYGEDSENVASSYINYGLTCKELGDTNKALKFYFKALEINEKVLGTNHPSTATSYNNIGVVYTIQGDLDKGLEYYFKALHILEIVLGTDHLDIATSYNNIGGVYLRQGIHKQSQGCFSKALDYYYKALAIQEKALGADHPDTATSYNNIGGAYLHQGIHKQSQGCFSKALDYYCKALTIFEKVLGTEHPSIATSYNNIAWVYFYQGKHGKVLELFFRALAIDEKVQGTNHFSTATDYNNIGMFYSFKRKYEKALYYLNRALGIREKELGYNHPDTKQTRESIEVVKRNLR